MRGCSARSPAATSARRESDIDILVDLDANVVRTVYDYVGIKHFIADTLGSKVDVIDRQSLASHARPSAIADQIHVF